MMIWNQSNGRLIILKKTRLGGAFFWELSKDRQAELISATFNALYKGYHSSSSMRSCFPSYRPPSTSFSTNTKAKSIVAVSHIDR